MDLLIVRPRAQVYADDGFDDEVLVAETLGMEVAVVPLEEVVHGLFEEALESLPPPAGRLWLLRSWLLSAEEVEGLWEAIRARGERLVVPPAAFEEATYLPQYAPILGDRTPESVWTDDPDPEEAWELAQDMGPPPWILKDHVKSGRPHWHEAVYVPEDADQERFTAICEALLDLRGDRFERGFVVRRFVPLETVGWALEERGASNEHRLVYWNRRLAAQAPYYDADLEPPPPGLFERLGEELASPFFVADVARTARGEWIVIELNDGTVARLPERIDLHALYQEMLEDPV